MVKTDTPRVFRCMSPSSRCMSPSSCFLFYFFDALAFSILPCVSASVIDVFGLVSSATTSQKTIAFPLLAPCRLQAICSIRYYLFYRGVPATNNNVLYPFDPPTRWHSNRLGLNNVEILAIGTWDRWGLTVKSASGFRIGYGLIMSICPCSHPASEPTVDAP